MESKGGAASLYENEWRGWMEGGGGRQPLMGLVWLDAAR